MANAYIPLWLSGWKNVAQTTQTDDERWSGELGNMKNILEFHSLVASCIFSSSFFQFGLFCVRCRWMIIPSLRFFFFVPHESLPLPTCIRWMYRPFFSFSLSRLLHLVCPDADNEWQQEVSFSLRWRCSYSSCSGGNFTLLLHTVRVGAGHNIH